MNYGWFGMTRLMKAAFLILCLFLASCANMDRKIKDVNVRSPIKEPVSALAIVFVRPTADPSQDPGLIQGYRLAGAFNDDATRRSGERTAEFLGLNGVTAKYVGAFGPQIDFKSMLRDWAGKGYHSALFLPVGSKVTSQNGTPIAGTVRYRVIVYSKGMVPMLEFYDDYQPAAWNSNAVDTSAAGWLNTLVDNGYVQRATGTKFVQPPYRDFIKEDAEKRRNEK